MLAAAATLPSSSVLFCFRLLHDPFLLFPLLGQNAAGFMRIWFGPLCWCSTQNLFLECRQCLEGAILTSWNWSRMPGDICLFLSPFCTFCLSFGQQPRQVAWLGIELCFQEQAGGGKEMGKADFQEVIWLPFSLPQVTMPKSPLYGLITLAYLIQGDAVA